MTTEPNACNNAATNVRRAVNSDWSFPHNVFVGDWREFLFFDSDWMLDEEFVGHARIFLEIEGGECACLRKVDSIPDGTATQELMIHGLTTEAQYHQLLNGATLGFGWYDDLDRLACASNLGEWCIYCEPTNDIAVVAFRHPESLERYRIPISLLHARRVEDALKEPPFYGFTDRALSEQWRDEFRREYSAR